MGLRLYTPDESQTPPKAVWLQLTCDGDHGLLTAPQATFRDDGYIAQRKAATNAGWRFCGDGRHLGPCCAQRGDAA